MTDFDKVATKFAYAAVVSKQDAEALVRSVAPAYDEEVQHG